MGESFEQEFLKQRVDVLKPLYANPRKFAATLYSVITTGPAWNREIEIFSPYLETDYEYICCLIKEDGERKARGKPTICIYSKVKQIPGNKEGIIYLITLPPEFPQDNFVLKTSEITPQISYLYTPPTSIKAIQQMSRREELFSCLYPNLTNLNLIGSDGFTNEYLIGYLLRTLYDQQKQVGLDGIARFQASTICHKQKDINLGSILTEYADFGNINDFVKLPFITLPTDYTDATGKIIKIRSVLPSVVIEILKQIAINLDFLHQTVQFNHGDLKTANILISSKTSKGNYRGLLWDSGFTVKIADFSRSSLTITINNKPIRLFNHNLSANAYLTVVPFKPILGNFFNEPYYILDTTLNAAALALIRHMGVPFYFSFDTYTVLVSLLLIPEIFYPIMSTDSLRKSLWENLWFPDEISEAWKRLYSAMSSRKPNSYDTIIDIIKGLKLKCRANEILFGVLRTLPS